MNPNQRAREKYAHLCGLPRARQEQTMTDHEFLENVRRLHGEFGVRLATLFGLAKPPEQPTLSDTEQDELDHWDDEPEPVWLNQGQVCELLNVSVNTLKDWIEKGKFPPAEDKHGSQKVWTEVNVRAWIVRNKPNGLAG